MASAKIQNTTMLTIPQLIDTALNCKEGIINFFALQTLLYAMVEQLNLNETTVDCRIDRSSTSAESVTTISKDHKKKKGKKLSLQDVKKEELKEKELRTIERRKDSKEDPDGNPLPLKSPQYFYSRISDSQSNVATENDTVKVTKSKELEPESSELLTIEDKVLKLYQKVDELGEIPERVTVLEQDLEKIDNLVQVLGQETGRPEISEKMQEIKKSKKETTNILLRVKKLERAVFKKQKQEDLHEETNSKHSDVDFDSILESVKIEEMPPAEAISMFLEEFTNLKTWVVDSLTKMKKTTDTEDDDDTKIIECFDKINNMDILYNKQIKLIQTEFETVQQEMAKTVTQLETIMSSGDFLGAGKETIADLTNKLHFLEKEILEIQEKAMVVDDEREERDNRLMYIVEQIDVLKIIKANREDLEDALGDKADACMINRKVSHDQFDAAFDELAHGIDDALKKLQNQEEMWKETLISIQKDVGRKIDKNEVDPLKDFVNSKLQKLQEKFKSLTALRKEQEAAGTKSKLLRNVNCISCDKDVVMQKEVDGTLKPKPYVLPPSRSMGPYLAYELDQLRKQQKCTPSGKNLNFLEKAVKTQMSKKKDHLCNRYCGGSHTLTTPQQRVTRLGHFLEQWGPEIAPSSKPTSKEKPNHVNIKPEEEKKILSDTCTQDVTDKNCTTSVASLNTFLNIGSAAQNIPISTLNSSKNNKEIQTISNSKLLEVVENSSGMLATANIRKKSSKEFKQSDKRIGFEE